MQFLNISTLGGNFFTPLVLGLGNGCCGICLSFAGLCRAIHCLGAVCGCGGSGAGVCLGGGMIRETNFPDLFRGYESMIL